MELRTYRPAHSICRGVSPLRLIGFIFILVILSGAATRPAAARKIDRSLLGLDNAHKLSLPVGVSGGALAWADYDNDGDLDLLATGETISSTGSTPKTTLFVNNNGSFSERALNFQNVQSSSAAWGDYDNDGNLDLLLTGQVRVQGGSEVIGFAGVYHNVVNNGVHSFQLVQTLPNIYQGSGTWGDYDNDGRLDILLTGNTDGAAPFARIYHNGGNSSPIFSGSNTPSVTPVGASATVWGDFNKDRYIDFAISGMSAGDIPITQVYTNNRNGGFTMKSLTTGVWNGTVNFIDYDLDGYLDLLITGNSGTDISPNISPRTILYHYNHSNDTFNAVPGTGLPELWDSFVSVGDYNNDGYPDLAMGGKTLNLLPNQIWVNNKNGTFTNAQAALPDGAGIVPAWGDNNGDRTLDLALTGVPVYDPGSGEEKYYTYIYPNSQTTGNNAPAAPALRAACWNGTDKLYFYWSSATDTSGSGSQLPSNSLTYNVKVGTTTGEQDVINAASNLTTGFHRLPAAGNAFSGTTAVLNVGTTRDTYYWSVQSVDASYVGGLFQTTPAGIADLNDHVANDDIYTLEDNAVNEPLNVLANDSAPGSPLPTIFSYTTPSHGTLTLDAPNNRFLYTPETPYQGTVSFTYYALRGSTLYCSLGKVTITVNQHNDPPSQLTLSNTNIPDGALVNTVVGQFTTTDPDVGETFTYSLSPANGYDNAAFHIVNNQLLTSTAIHYATKSTYSINVRTTDRAGAWIERPFTLHVIQNHPPTSIALTPATVLEHQPIDTIVGVLTTTDPDTTDTSFTYTVVSSPGCATACFYIMPGTTRLRTSVEFDLKTRGTYPVRIRSMDRGNLYTEADFTITILPTTPRLSWFDSAGGEHPSKETIPPIVMSEDGKDNYNQPNPFHLTVLATDDGLGENITWNISSQAAHGQATASGRTASGGQEEIHYIPDENWNSADGRGNDQFVVRATDPGGNYVEVPVSVTVLAVNDPPSFDLIADKQYYELSSRQSITITGINTGKQYETGQTVQLTAQCSTTPDYECAPSTITNLSVTPVRSNGTATLTFTVKRGSGDSTILVIARETGQSFNNTFARIFKITILPATVHYLPFIRR